MPTQNIYLGAPFFDAGTIFADAIQNFDSDAGSTTSQWVFKAADGSTVVFGGSFTLSAGHVTEGTATSFAVFELGVIPLLNATGYYLPLFLLQPALAAFQTGNPAPFFHLLDVSFTTINGSHDKDTIVAPKTYGANIFGGGGDDELIGQTGNNYLYGGAGADIMRGGDSGDKFFVDNPGDQIIEAIDQGFDIIISEISFKLPANVEELLLVGTFKNSDGTGNALDNYIDGNSATNRIDGGAGNDFLVGGAGADIFVFSTPLSATNIDTILDLSFGGKLKPSGHDTIELAKHAFSELNSGKLSSGFFHVGRKAGDKDDFIIYNDRNGKLFYNSDGKGHHKPIQFAQLEEHLALSHSDFLVV